MIYPLLHFDTQKFSGCYLQYCFDFVDFIQRLISKNKVLEAVPFIFAFGLVDKFPPVPLLRMHAERAEKNYKKICSRGRNSLKAVVCFLNLTKMINFSSKRF